MIKLNIYTSLITSIIIQILTGVIEIASIFINVPLKYFFIKQMMMLEIIVQVIEGTFYIYWLYNFKKISNITPKRYLDWMITTPTMLINLIFYLIFLKDNNKELNFFTLFKKEIYTIVLILILNWLMLLFGYLSEISLISTTLGVSIGFIPFIIYYYIIYKKYALLSKEPYKIKNMCYNILDLFSKNFFGLFLTYILFSSRTKTTSASRSIT